MADSMTNGLYEHDILGRLTRKVEGGSDVVFDYVDGSYRPVAVSVNGNEIERSLAFDPAGNLWMNGVNNVAYKLNDAGLPEKALLYGAALPADISLDGIEADAGPGADSSVIYAYDAGARVYERRDAGDDYVSGRVTVPGLGVYGRGAETAFSMERLDLVGGGYRTGADGAALFPLTDAQGSIRAYANHSGLRGAHAYYPYGTAKEVAVDAGEDSRRWQSKEYDGGIGNYYFGARYYDPFLGLWISPDPAGQYMNPYGYGGDPVNYVDPTGLWTIGAGIVVGWDSHHGWHLGLGAAFDLTDGDSNGFGANLSYTWNQDGSESFNVGANFSFLLDAGASYSYNSYTGQTLSGNVGVCLGTKSVACAGADVGGSLYWDGGGDFMGATAYAEFQSSVLGGFANVSSGYEWGFLGMEGRGLYAGGTAMGIHGEWSQLNSFDVGFNMNFYYGVGDTYGDFVSNGMQKKVHLEFWMPFLGALGHYKIGDTYDTSHDGLEIALENHLLKMLRSCENSEKWIEKIEGSRGHLSREILTQLVAFLNQNGFSTEVLSFPFDWSTSTDKLVVYDKNSNDYPHAEFKYYQNGIGSAFSSYNYGSDIVSHILIDFFGYYIPRWVYGVHD